mgnify:CR=1 FL=1
MKDDCKPKRRITLWKRDLGDDMLPCVILGPEDTFKLNEVGYRVWILMDGKNTIRSICSKIGHQYPEVDEADIRSDVMALIEVLDREKLIELDYDSLYSFSAEGYLGYPGHEFQAEL